MKNKEVPSINKPKNKKNHLMRKNPNRYKDGFSYVSMCGKYKGNEKNPFPNKSVCKQCLR